MNKLNRKFAQAAYDKANEDYEGYKQLQITLLKHKCDVNGFSMLHTELLLRERWAVMQYWQKLLDGDSSASS